MKNFIITIGTSILLLGLKACESSLERSVEMQEKIVYDFADGLQIDEFWDQSCLEGETGKLMHKLSKIQEELLYVETFDITIEDLEAVAERQKKKIFQNYRVIKDSRYRKLKRIFKRLEQHTLRRDIRYQIFLVESYKLPFQLNAWVTYDGTIFLTTEMLEFIQSSDELAFVLAHEFCHVENLLPDKLLARDRKIANMLGENGFSRVLRGAISNIFAGLNQYDEIIADRAALYLLYEAGYDPEKSLDFFDKLENMDEDDQRLQFLEPFFNTHPYHHTRFDCLNSYLYDSRSVVEVAVERLRESIEHD